MNLQRIGQRLVEVIRHPGLYRDALFLAAATMTSGLGSLIYWKLITLRFSPDMVGLTSVGISSATFLGGLANMGLTVGLVRFLPKKEPALKAGMVRLAVQASLLLGIPVCAIFLSGRRWWAPALVPPEAGVAYLVVFVLLLFSTTQMNTNGAVIQAERRTPYLLVQSMVINTVQIAGGVLVAVSLGVTGVLFTYTLPILVVALGFYFVLPRLGHFSGARPLLERGLAHELLRYGLGIQVYSVVWQLPAFLFPLMVLKMLGAAANANLVLTWYAYAFLTIIPIAVMAALLMEGSYEPDLLRRHAWDALQANLVFLIPIVACVIVLAPWLLSLFGKPYMQAATLLRLLAASTLPVSINGIYLTLLRVRKQMIRLNLLVTSLVVLSIFLAYAAVGPLGLNGIGWGWLAGQLLFASVSLIFLVREHNQMQTKMMARTSLSRPKV
jgi:O-antigen/teichoic acid export membrane protein